MSFRTSRNIILFLVISLFLGCATVNTLDKVREEKPERKKVSVLNYSYDEVFAAALAVCKDLDLRIYSVDAKNGEIYAKSLVRWLLLIPIGFGEKVAIYVVAVDDQNTNVEVVLQKVYLLSIGYTDWRQKVLNAIANNLKKDAENPKKDNNN